MTIFIENLHVATTTGDYTKNGIKLPPLLTTTLRKEPSRHH